MACKIGENAQRSANLWVSSGALNLGKITQTLKGPFILQEDSLSNAESWRACELILYLEEGVRNQEGGKLSDQVIMPLVVLVVSQILQFLNIF